MWWGWWGAGWIAGLVSGLLWLAVIIAAIVLLRRELPSLRHGRFSSPALRLLEERYARGEIEREDFLHRRDVLIRPPAEPGRPSTPTGDPDLGQGAGGTAYESPRIRVTPSPHTPATEAGTDTEGEGAHDAGSEPEPPAPEGSTPDPPAQPEQPPPADRTEPLPPLPLG